LLVTLKAVARLRGQQTPTQLLQSCKESIEAFANPGFQSKPWAGIGEPFSVIDLLIGLLKGSSDFLCKADPVDIKYALVTVVSICLPCFEVTLITCKKANIGEEADLCPSAWIPRKHFPSIALSMKCGAWLVV
jgi:hypothetical protein